MKILINKNKLSFVLASLVSGFAFSFFRDVFVIIPIIATSIYISYLLYLIDSSVTEKQVFYRTLFFNFLVSLISYHWILKPFTFLNINIFLRYIFSIIGLALISLYVSLYTAFASLVTYYHSNKIRYLIFAISYILMEGIKGFAFTGFDWNPIGSIWSNIPVILQSISIIGVRGLGFLTLLILGVPYLIYKKQFNIKYKISIGFILLIILSFGFIRLYSAKHQNSNFVIRVADLQIPQEFVNNIYIIKKYSDALNIMGINKVDLFILPESSIPFDITSNNDYEIILKNEYYNMNNNKSFLIGGANRYEGNNVFNSMVLLNKNSIIDIYDKLHLVPFGEYIPFQNLLPLQKFTEGVYNFKSGETTQILDIGNFKFFPLICYEAIFTGFNIPSGISGFVNISNDAWFGEWGKRQHFEIAKLRAVEYGIPLIRSANFGAKYLGASVISPYGFEVPAIIKTKYTKDFFLPKALNKTFFNKIGFYISYILSRLYLLYITKLFLMIFIARLLKKSK